MRKYLTSLQGQKHLSRCVTYTEQGLKVKFSPSPPHMWKQSQGLSKTTYSAPFQPSGIIFYFLFSLSPPPPPPSSPPSLPSTLSVKQWKKHPQEKISKNKTKQNSILSILFCNKKKSLLPKSDRNVHRG